VKELKKRIEPNTPQYALLFVSIALSARIAAMIEIRIDIDTSYNVSELRGRVEKLDEIAPCYYSLTRRERAEKMNSAQHAPIRPATSISCWQLKNYVHGREWSRHRRLV
jgi:hypothetical protein